MTDNESYTTYFRNWNIPKIYVDINDFNYLWKGKYRQLDIGNSYNILYNRFVPQVKTEHALS